MLCTRVVLLACLLSLWIGCATVQVDPEAYRAYRSGLSLFNRQRYEEALPRFRKATEIAPEFAQANLDLGRTYLHLWRWQEAVVSLRVAMRLAPEETRQVVADLLIDALLGVATSAFQRGDWPTSIAALRDLLTLAPGSSQGTTQLVAALLAFGGQLAAEGQLPEATAAYREALTLAPHSSQATRQLVAVLLISGRQLLQQGRAFEATTTYEEVTHLAPDNLEGYLGLAYARLHSGEVETVFPVLQEAFRLAPTSPEVIRLLRHLQQLR